MTSNDIPEPGTPEFDQFIDRQAQSMLIDRLVKRQCDRLEAEHDGRGASSWVRIDLNDAIYGDHPDIKPKVLRRSDNQALGYPGLTHSVHGPAGSGKTWFMLYAAAQQLKAGADVLYLDYESFDVQIVKRLAVLGVSGDAMKAHLHYHRPQSAPDVLDADRNAFASLLSHSYSLAVIDGANISMALCGLNPDSATDVAQWHAAIMLPVAERTGAATFAVDHVPKNNSTYSGFAIGSQHKVAGLTGAAFVAEKMQPFGRGAKGYATLRVSPEKDREGFVHGIGVNDDQPDGLLVAELHIDATAELTTFDLCPPSDEAIAAVADKRSKNKNGKKQSEDITYEMEVVSAYWDEKTTQAIERTQTKTIDALIARQRSGTKYERPLTNPNLRLAVKALIDPMAPGGPYAVENQGLTVPRSNKHPYINVKPYVRPANLPANNGNVVSISSLLNKSGTST